MFQTELLDLSLQTEKLNLQAWCCKASKSQRGGEKTGMKLYTFLSSAFGKLNKHLEIKPWKHFLKLDV